MGGIFISYRREDATGYVHALHERLANRFGRQQIFMDIDSIEPGLDFVEVLESSVAGCDVFLALIGKRWLESRRLGNSNDFVRLEIQAALARKIRVIPVLLEGAEMPKAEDLPEALAPLCRRQAFEISNRHFIDDLHQLTELLGRILGEQDAERPAAASPQKSLKPPAGSVRPIRPAEGRRQIFRRIAMPVLSDFAWAIILIEISRGASMTWTALTGGGISLIISLEVAFFLTTVLFVVIVRFLLFQGSSHTWKVLAYASLAQMFVTGYGSLLEQGELDFIAYAVILGVGLPFLFLAYRQQSQLPGRGEDRGL